MSTRQGKAKRPSTPITAEEVLQADLERLQRERQGVLDLWGDVDETLLWQVVVEGNKLGYGILYASRGASPTLVVYPPGRGSPARTYVASDAGEMTAIMTSIREAFLRAKESGQG